MEILYNSEIILVFSTRTCKKTLQFKPNISTALLSSWLYSSRLPHWPPRMFPPLDSAWMYANFLCTFKCGLKYIATPWKQTVILFGGNVSDSQPRRQHLNSSQTTAPKRQEGKSGYTQVCNKAGRQSEHQRLLLSKENRYQVKRFSVLACMGRCKNLGLLKSFLSSSTGTLPFYRYILLFMNSLRSHGEL